MAGLHPGRGRLPHCGCILLFSSLPSLAVNSDIVKNVAKKFMFSFFLSLITCSASSSVSRGTSLGTFHVDPS